MKWSVRPPAALILAALAVLVALAAAAPASAATRFVTVPLDRSGKVAGKVKLKVMTLPARSGKPRGTLFAEAGGPGDGAIEYFTRRSDVLATVRRDWNVVVVDQRGTGGSGLVSCTGLQTGASFADAVPACAGQLGAAKSLYTTAASADDIDDVRSALGVKRISIYGLSYGTWLGQTYAKRHPGRLDKLILDSVVSPALQDDPFLTIAFKALPRALRATCAAGACKGVTADPWADLKALAAKVATASLTGTVIDDQGRPQSRDVSIPLVVNAFTNLDLNPGLRAQQPAAVRRAIDGDPNLLLRLVDAGNTSPSSPPARFSVGVNTATGCEEKGLPWDRTTPQAERLAEARRRLEKIPESVFVPVPRALILAFGIPATCQYWPNAKADPLERGKLPDVPTLLLNGTADLRTPLEAAREVAKTLPRSQLIAVPNVGHNTLASTFTDCARRALADFLGGAKAKACGTTAFRAVAPPPTTLGSSTEARVAAAVMTVDDSVAQVRLRLRALQTTGGRVGTGGLLAGTLVGSDRSTTMNGVEVVPGLKVTGVVKGDGTGTIDVVGAATGSLTLTAKRVTGSLDGAKVDVARPKTGYV
jgi:pimeloyl-ACP methyl ester carboxylesterase